MEQRGESLVRQNRQPQEEGKESGRQVPLEGEQIDQFLGKSRGPVNLLRQNEHPKHKFGEHRPISDAYTGYII